jgi:hypothetical protein
LKQGIQPIFLNNLEGGWLVSLRERERDAFKKSLGIFTFKQSEPVLQG